MFSINNYSTLNNSFEWTDDLDPVLLNHILDDLPHPDAPSGGETPPPASDSSIPFFSPLSILISPIAHRTPTRAQLNESFTHNFEDDFPSFAFNVDENNQDISHLFDDPPQKRSRKRLEMSTSSSTAPPSAILEAPPLQPLPKRARTSKSKTIGKKHHNYTKASYAVALHLLLMNKLPNQKPNNITVERWNQLNNLSERSKLVEIVSRSPFVIKIDAELEYVYYTFARFGRSTAMQLDADSEVKFEERKKWWSESQVFGSISISRPQAQSSNENWIYATIELPHAIREITQNYYDIETLAVISKILGDALLLSIQSRQIRKVFKYGVERQTVRLLLPLDKAIENATIQPQSTNLSSSSMVLSASNPTASVKVRKYQANFNTLVKFLALTIIFSKKLPSEKPAYLSDDDIWESAIQRQNSSSLVTAITSENAVLSFTTPYFYSEYCRRVALRGTNEAMKSRKVDIKRTYYRWWSNAKALFPFKVSCSSPKNDPVAEIRSIITHAFTLPTELTSSARFNMLTPEEQLNVVCQLFKNTLEECLSEKPYEQLVTEGLVVKKDQRYVLANKFPKIYKKCVLQAISELDS